MNKNIEIRKPLIVDKIIGMTIKLAVERYRDNEQISKRCWKEMITFLKKNPQIVTEMLLGITILTWYDEWDRNDNEQAVNTDYIGLYNEQSKIEYIRFIENQEIL